MKLTEKQLKEIIKEEVAAVVGEKIDLVGIVSQLRGIGQGLGDGSIKAAIAARAIGKLTGRIIDALPDSGMPKLK